MFVCLSSRRRHTSWPREWRSDVCSSELWEEKAEVDIHIDKDFLVLKVPKKLLGIIGEEVDIEFKWNDNMQENGNIMDFYVNGDTAPGGRFNFVYKVRK